MLNIDSLATLDFIYSVYPCLAETLRGSNFLAGFSILYFTLCPFETKMERIFCFWTRNVFLN
jgi:hypothetical protein